MKNFIKSLRFVCKYSNGIKSKILFLLIVNIINISLRIALPMVSAQVIIKLTIGAYNELIYWGGYSITNIICRKRYILLFENKNEFCVSKFI